jgi:hypothetical protein
MVRHWFLDGQKEMNLITTSKHLIKSLLRIGGKKPVRLKPLAKINRGIALVSYLDTPVRWAEHDARFDGHSVFWESNEIIFIFRTLGFTVDVIDWGDTTFITQEHYDVVFDIHTNLQRFAPFLGPSTKKIQHLTGSSPQYQRLAELRRVDALEKRTGMLYSPKRIDKDLDLAERSYKLADICSLLGNYRTLNTYPKEYQSKIHLVPVSGSRLSYRKKHVSEYVPPEREFMWFYGSGAVHKGLDLVLEVFKKYAKLHLHVVGNVASERDFVQIYRKELFETANITYHGHLMPSSERFQTIANRVVANIAPSCSEGISPASVTCMQIGFFPIISVDNGITLPNGAGVSLFECTHTEIEERILEVYSMSADRLAEQIVLCQKHALKEFSRENYSVKMRDFIAYALG